MQRHYFADKYTSSQSYGFSSGHVWMWELDCKESWAPKNWCFWTVVLEKTLESPLDCKEIQLVHPRGNQSWIFIGRTDAEAETPILWSPDAKRWLTGKDPDAGKDWRREEKGMTEDEMVGWHHCFYGHESEQAPEVGDGQGSLACCSPWGLKESDPTEQMSWAERIHYCRFCTLQSLLPVYHLYGRCSCSVTKSWWLFETTRTAACQAPRLPLPLRACSNSCPLSWWRYPTISSSVTEFCQENTLVIANTLFQQHLRWIYTMGTISWSITFINFLNIIFYWK